MKPNCFTNHRYVMSSTNKILVSGLVGGVVLFLLGWLVWGFALADFFQTSGGSATGIAKLEPGGMDMLYMLLGCIAGGMLFSVIFGRWAGIKTFQTGAIAGAIIGILIALNVDLVMLGSSNIHTLSTVLVDVVANGIVMAVIGGVVGWMLGRGVPELEEAMA